jgi:V8-like Glu-specific endopeptidase
MKGTSAKLFVTGAILAVASGNSIGTVSAQRGQSNVVSESTNTFAAQAAADVRAYWTPERLASARPVTLSAALNAFEAEPGAAAGAPVSTQGARPTVSVTPDPGNFLLDPSTVPAFEEDLAMVGEEVEPSARGTSGLPYSNTRNVPFTAATDNAYPHRTIGKWFFTKPGVGNFVCSASVIRHRIVVTAGHCLHQGSGGSAGFFTNFMFVPSYRNGAAPFGSWTRRQCAVTATWATGGGTVPNAADYGMCDMNDRSGNRIGNVTGFLGWLTLNLARNHAHIFGYPCNLDSCQYMNQTTAGNGPANGNNTIIYGSNQRGGVSGGPYIQNFGLAPPCSAGCTATNQGRNQVIGIASYISTSTAPHYLGSSIPDNRWVTLYNTVCGFRAGNCS